MKRAYLASDSATTATSSVTSHSSAPAPKRKRGRPPKRKAVASAPPPFRSFASLFRDGLVPVSALNACLEHDSLAGARAFAGREAMAALQQAQESLRTKGFVVLYVDAPPSGFETGGGELEVIGRRFEKVRSRRARQVRRWKGHKEEPLKQTVGNDPVLFHFLTSVGRLVLKAASWSLCPFSDPSTAAGPAGAADNDNGHHPEDEKAGPFPPRAKADDGGVDLEAELMGPHPLPDDKRTWAHCRSRLWAQKHIRATGERRDVGLLGIHCCLGPGLEVEDDAGSSEEDYWSDGGYDSEVEVVRAVREGSWRAVPPFSAACRAAGGGEGRRRRGGDYGYELPKEEGPGEEGPALAAPYTLLVAVGQTLERATAGGLRVPCRRVALRAGRGQVSPLEVAFSLRGKRDAVLNAVGLCHRASIAPPGLDYEEMARLETVGEYEARNGGWDAEEQEAAAAAAAAKEGGGTGKGRARGASEMVEVVDEGEEGEGQEQEGAEGKALAALPVEEEPEEEQEEEPETEEEEEGQAQEPEEKRPEEPEAPAAAAAAAAAPMEVEAEPPGQKEEMEIEQVGGVRPRRLLLAPARGRWSVGVEGQVEGEADEEEDDGGGAAGWEEAGSEDGRAQEQELEAAAPADDEEAGASGEKEEDAEAGAAATAAAAVGTGAGQGEEQEEEEQQEQQQEQPPSTAAAEPPAEDDAPAAPAAAPMAPPPPVAAAALAAEPAHAEQPQQPDAAATAASSPAVAAAAAAGPPTVVPDREEEEEDGPPPLVLVVQAGLLPEKKFRIFKTSHFRKLARKFSAMYAAVHGGERLPLAAFRFTKGQRVLDPMVPVGEQGLRSGDRLEVELMLAEGI